MSKDKLDLKVRVNEEDGEVKITITDEEKTKIPRVGDSLYIVTPYPVITEDMVGEPVNEDNEEDGVVLNEDVKEKQVKGYSYDSQMVKATVLSDAGDSVRINGDFVVPLRENGEPKSKLLIFTDEREARDKFRTLMNVSIAEANRKEKLNARLKSYLKESLEKMHH